MDAPDLPPAPRTTGSRWPRWTSWFLVRAALCAGMVWMFEEGPRAFRWPLRFAIPVVFVFAVIAFVRDSRWLIAGVSDWISKVSRVPLPGQRAAARIERGLAWGVVLVVAAHFALMIGQMSRTSLREDEIGTIGQYSSRGPVETMTKYNLAKNHVLFNLANSVLPGRGSYHPLRARLFSFVAVGATLAVVGWWFFRRREYAEGALALALLGSNTALYGVSLEARGYGFLLGCASLAALALPGALASSAGSRGLAVLALTAVVGIYTIPSYAVFGGLLLLAVWFAVPTRRSFLAGWYAFFALALLYLPLAGQVAQVAEDYDEKYADLFGDLKRMQFALRFLVPREVWAFSDWSLVLALAALCLVPAIVGVYRAERVRAAALLGGMILAFYAFCLVLRTPPDRVTAFLAGPFAIGLAFLLGEVRRSPRLAWAGSWTGVVFALALLLCGAEGIRRFEYHPPQRWRDVALFVQALFPPGTQVWVAGSYWGANAVYLGPDYPVRTGALDRAAYGRGDWILQDDRYRFGERPMADEGFAPEGRIMVPVPVRGSETRLFFARPVASKVEMERTTEGWLLRTDGGAYALGVEAAAGWQARAGKLRVEVREGTGGAWRRSEGRVEGRFLAVRLPGSAGPFEVRLPAAGAGDLISAWAVPVRAGAGPAR